MKRLPFALFFCMISVGVHAQIYQVDFAVDTRKDTVRISPYIYGSNDQGDDPRAGVTALRAGGNRWTGYNWENNASNAGTDYINHSDNYMTYGLPDSDQSKPGFVPFLFHQDASIKHAYALVTLPAAGFVAADKAGTVAQNDTAPSPRWKQVEFHKPTPFVFPPDLLDGVVYDDEEVNYLVQSSGSSQHGGVRGYACDNEPALWPSTHPRIHPGQTTCAEVISKDSALALAVKAVDPKAEIFGPVSYGFAEFNNNQSAPDWNNYKNYGRWIDAYLAKMHEAENAVGKRLLDVLDLHWYPEAQGLNRTGALERIALDTSTAPGVMRARMDAPRTLWDSSYREDSWIGQYFSPVALLPWLKSSIATNYPGTKLAFTEINYGGDFDISGAIAMTDVLGIFGRYGVYMSNYWGSVVGDISTAYRMYQNYDGLGSKFGDVSVLATTSGIDSTSIYAAIRSNDPNTMDVILINKSMYATVGANVSVASNIRFDSAFAYAADRSLPSKIQPMGSYAIQQGSFRADLAPLSIVHYVLRHFAPSSVAHGIALQEARVWLTARNLTIETPIRGSVHLIIRDVLGRTIVDREIELQSGKSSVFVPNLAPSVYSITVLQGSAVVLNKRVVVVE